MKKLINYIAVTASILLYSANAMAVCEINTNLNSALILNKVIVGETIYVQYDGTNPIIKQYSIVSADSRFNFATSASTTCNANFVIEWYKPVWPDANGNQLKSNIPGVGIEATLTYTELNSSPRLAEVEETIYWGNKSQRFERMGWNVKLMRTGEITQEGIIRPNVIARAYMRNNPTGGTTITSHAVSISFGNNFRIVPLSCSLKNTSPTLNINMGDWFDKQFQGIGSTSAEVAIPITLNCLAGTNIKVLITSSDYVDTATGKIGLSGNDKATGIAIQLLDHSNKPIELNKKISIDNAVPVGDYALSWNARYIKTADKITAGSANASATVNIIYE